jgi:predicted amidohydrolase
MQRIIKQAKKKKADLVAFPELSLTGYVVRDRAYELAEPVPDGPSIQQIEEISKKENVHIVFGMIERSTKASAVLHNIAVLISPKGYIGKYQKMYLPTHSVFEEKRYFRPGYQIPVFETEIGKLGIIICYDVYFPEVARMLSLKGAKLIVCISASPSVRRGFFETLTAARAIENTVFVAFVNLAGIEDGLQFWGGSRIIAPSGNLISQAKYDEDDLITARINYSDLTRVQAWVPTLRDLRPEIFSSLREEAESL